MSEGLKAVDWSPKGLKVVIDRLQKEITNNHLKFDPALITPEFIEGAYAAWMLHPGIPQATYISFHVYLLSLIGAE